MKKRFLLILITLLPMVALTSITSCSKDNVIEESDNGNNNDNNTDNNSNNNNGNSNDDNNDQQIPELVVTVDANGKADGGHQFIKIDESNFYIDGIKYTVTEGNLFVTGYISSYNLGHVKIISTLKYNGQAMNVTNIGAGAFRGCTSMISISIPNSVTNIGYEAFYHCRGLLFVAIGNGVKKAEDGAFNGCDDLIKVIVPDIAAWCSISYHGRDGNPLIYAQHLYSDENTEITNLVIPDGVTSVCRYAFYGCSSLSSISIPKSVTNIGQDAFDECSGLTDVYCYAENVPETEYTYVFDSWSIKSAILHVPAGSVNAYKSKSPWDGFKDIVAIEK